MLLLLALATGLVAYQVEKQRATGMYKEGSDGSSGSSSSSSSDSSADNRSDAASVQGCSSCRSCGDAQDVQDEEMMFSVAGRVDPRLRIRR